VKFLSSGGSMCKLFLDSICKKTYLLVCEKLQTSADYLFTGNTIYIY